MDSTLPLGPVAFVLLLLGGVTAILRRRGLTVPGRAGRDRVIDVLEARAVGPGHTIVAIRSHGRRLLVMTHARGCTLLDSGEEAGS